MIYAKFTVECDNRVSGCTETVALPHPAGWAQREEVTGDALWPLGWRVWRGLQFCPEHVAQILAEFHRIGSPDWFPFSGADPDSD